METALSQLSYLPTTLAQVQSFAAAAKNEILSGSVDLKELLYKKKCIERTLEAIFDDEKVNEVIKEEITKYGKDGAGYNDAKFEIASRKSWDYSQTNDKEFDILEQKAKAAANDLKDRQKFLQTLSKPIEVLNNETGEIETIYPAAFRQSEYIKTTFKK